MCVVNYSVQVQFFCLNIVLLYKHFHMHLLIVYFPRSAVAFQYSLFCNFSLMNVQFQVFTIALSNDLKKIIMCNFK